MRPPREMRAESGPSGPSGIAPFCVLGAEERNRVTEHCTCMKSHFYLGRLCAVGRWIGEMERTHCPSPVADHTFTNNGPNARRPWCGWCVSFVWSVCPEVCRTHSHGTEDTVHAHHLDPLQVQRAAPRVRPPDAAATRTSTPPWRLALVDIRTRSAYRHSPTHHAWRPMAMPAVRNHDNCRV